jgi:hypothetical protein
VSENQTKVNVEVLGHRIEISQWRDNAPPQIGISDHAVIVDVTEWDSFVAGVTEAIRAYRALEAIANEA